MPGTNSPTPIVPRIVLPLTKFIGLRPRYRLTYGEIEIFGDAKTKQRAAVRNRYR